MRRHSTTNTESEGQRRRRLLPLSLPLSLPLTAVLMLTGCLMVLTGACGSSVSEDAEAFPPVSEDGASPGDPVSAVEAETSDDSSDSAAAPETTTTSTTESTPTSAIDAVTGKPLLEIPTEWESELDEIFGRYLLYWEALDIAMGLPEATPDYEPLRELTEQSFYEDVRAQVAEFQEEALVITYPEESIRDHVVRLPNPTVLTKTEGNEVIIQDCFVDDGRVETLEGVLQNSFYESVLRNVTMRVIDGEWRLWASTDASQDSDGYQECKDYINELP